MDAFGVGIFSQLAQMRAQRVSQGLPVVDLSVGAPNIAPAPHIMQALSREALVPENYLYALGDTQALREAVAAWYLRRYGVTLDPASEIVSLLGSQEGLAHIALSIVDPRRYCPRARSLLPHLCRRAAPGGRLSVSYAAACGKRVSHRSG